VVTSQGNQRKVMEMKSGQGNPEDSRISQGSFEVCFSKCQSTKNSAFSISGF